MIKGLLHSYLYKAILLALLGLILYGVFPGAALAIILLVFVLLRFTSLLAEGLRIRAPSEREEGPVDGLRRARISETIRGCFPPRPMYELGAEALGVIAFAILVPLDIALYGRDFFSLQTWQSWEGAIVAALSLACYAWPHRWLKSPGFSGVRSCWWMLPFLISLPLLCFLIQTRHAYLNPFDPDHNRLAAERVLALKNNVIAGQHANWVLRYARQLDEHGDSQQAIHFYREGLRLDPNDRDAYARLTRLEAQSSDNFVGSVANPAVSSSAPYWTPDMPITKSPRLQIDSQLDNVEGCTVVIVPVGEVADELLDSVGYVIHHELDLPVYISINPVPLPPHTRKRGLATGPQWDQDSLVQTFTNAVRSFPNAPIKYVLITRADTYMNDVNYVFSATYSWGALVSSARFRGPGGDDSILRERTAKQALCALIKSFNVPMSPDRNCVTSYTRSLEEFDAKGNRPNGETLKLFRQAVADLNSAWTKYKARP